MRSKKICAAVLAAVLAAGSTAVYASAEAGTPAMVAETKAAEITWQAPTAYNGLSFTESDGVYAATVTESLLNNTSFSPMNATIGRNFDGYWLGFYVNAADKDTNTSSTVTYKSVNKYVADLNPVTIKGLFSNATNGSSTDGQFWAGFRYDWLANAPSDRQYLVYAVEFDLGNSEKKYVYAAFDCSTLSEGFAFENACTTKDHTTLDEPCAICGNKKIESFEGVEYSNVATAYPAGFTDADKLAFAESITDGMTASVKDGNKVVVTFAKSNAAIKELVEDYSGDRVDPVYLNISTNIPNTITAGNTAAEAGKFTWVSGYSWDESDHSFNFKDGRIMLWLPATATNDTITIKYKVGTGEAQTLTINYEYAPVAFEDTDTETGITASAEAGAVPEGTELVVVPGENDPEGEVSFDITLVDGDGSPVQPAAGKSVTVSIPVPASMTANKSDLKVFYKNGATYTNMNAVVEGDKLVFNTTHFSTYVVTTKNLALNNPLTHVTPVDPVTTTPTTSTSSDTASSDASSSDTASSDVSSSDVSSTGDNSSDVSSTGDNSSGSASSGTSNPATGIAMGIFPVVLAAGAIVVIARKKK